MLQQDNAIKNGELEEDADVTERRRARLELCESAFYY